MINKDKLNYKTSYPWPMYLMNNFHILISITNTILNNSFRSLHLSTL